MNLPTVVNNLLLVTAVIAALVITQNPLALFCLTFLQIAQPPRLDIDELTEAVAERLTAPSEPIGFVNTQDD